MLFLKFLQSIGVPSFLNQFKQKHELITILCFHRVSPVNDPFWPPLHPKIFDSILEYISKNYEVVSFEGMEIPTVKPKLLITFDDGYKDFIEYALPILVKYNFPSSHAIVTDCADQKSIIWTQELNMIIANYLIERRNLKVNFDGVDYNVAPIRAKLIGFKNQVRSMLFQMGRSERKSFMERIKLQPVEQKELYMNWDDLLTCHQNKVEILSHTISHDLLDTINDEKLLEHELLDSKIILSQKIGKNIVGLTLPNGEFNKHVIQKAKEVGYERILLLDDKFERESRSEGDILHSRIGMYHKSLIENIFRIEGFYNHAKKVLKAQALAR